MTCTNFCGDHSVPIWITAKRYFYWSETTLNSFMSEMYSLKGNVGICSFDGKLLLYPSVYNVHRQIHKTVIQVLGWSSLKHVNLWPRNRALNDVILLASVNTFSGAQSTRNCLLTHWPLGDPDAILKLQFSILFYWFVFSQRLMIMPWDEAKGPHWW